MTACPHGLLSCNDCITIPLVGRGGIIRGAAFVSNIDYLSVEKYRWWLHPLGYAVRRERRDERPRGRLGVVYLHRQILGLTRKNKAVADHINQDKLDCRRENLRALKWGDNSFGNIQRWESARRGFPEVDIPSLYEPSGASELGITKV